MILMLAITGVRANSLLLPMDSYQTNHLKAYGIVYWALTKEIGTDWLLNYRGGSFLIEYSDDVRRECIVRGVAFELLTSLQTNSILQEISQPNANMELVRLEKAPRIAVYTPTAHGLVTDETDAVVLVLDYAEIKYDKIYDEEILRDDLAKYDWLHLHHEDFTGQLGRSFRRASQMIEAKMQEGLALKLGYTKVSVMKRDVSRKIKAFCASGGYLFAMCSGAETFDIALAADGIDIVASEYDGDDADPLAQEKLDFTQTLAFENFTLEEPGSRKFSDINSGSNGSFFMEQPLGYFRLFNFSAKWDIIPTMLVQNHTDEVKEFYGQTTSFQSSLVKPLVQVLGENRMAGNARYIYGELGNGHWTYYSGHDPEGIPGRGRGSVTNLDLFPHSPGYRLILNNVLFPSAKKKKQKT
jgi:hypothetical protein